MCCHYSMQCMMGTTMRYSIHFTHNIIIIIIIVILLSSAPLYLSIYLSLYIYSIYPINSVDLRPANEFFHAKVQALVDELDKRLQRVRHKYSYVLDYFGEDSTMRSQEFFTSLHKFIQEFSTVRDHIDRVKRAEAMVKKKK